MHIVTVSSDQAAATVEEFEFNIPQNVADTLITVYYIDAQCMNN